MHLRINCCQIYIFLYQNAMFYRILPCVRVRDKNEHYVKRYQVTAYSFGRAMFFKELSCDRFVKVFRFDTVFSDTTPIFFNRLKRDFILVRSLSNFRQ